MTARFKIGDMPALGFLILRTLFFLALVATTVSAVDTPMSSQINRSPAVLDEAILKVDPALPEDFSDREKADAPAPSLTEERQGVALNEYQEIE